MPESLAWELRKSLTFNVANKRYDVAAARERYKVYRELDIHFQHMENLKKIFSDNEKEYTESEEAEISQNEQVLTTSNLKTMMKQKSHEMAEIIKELTTGIEGISMKEAIAFVKMRTGTWYGFKDDCMSTILHVAAEKKMLVECLLACGAEVNSREGFGITPLHLAVINDHVQVVRILLQYDAKPSGSFPGNVNPLHYKLLYSNRVQLKFADFYKKRQLK